MRTSRIFLLSTLILAACNASPAATSGEYALRDRLQNPLFAERYWAEMVERMADFVRTGHPLSKDPVASAVMEAERTRGLARLADARKKKEGGLSGSFFKVTDDVQGAVLLVGSTLSFGTEFLAYPEPEQHVYLTTVVDPRETEFPDATSVDLGELESPYGAQQYAIPEGRMDPRFRTVVLYDRQLKVITAIAQLGAN